jgi:hypothetical protein
VESRERPGRRRSGVLGRTLEGESDRDASDGDAGVEERDFERVMRWGTESSEVVTVVDTVVVVVAEMGPLCRFEVRWASSASDCRFSCAGVEELDVSETCMNLFSTPLKLLFWLTGTSSSAASNKSLPSPLPESVIRIGDEDAVILASWRFVVLWYGRKLVSGCRTQPREVEKTLLWKGQWLGKKVDIFTMATFARFH